jgi:peroxiredoxin
VQLTQYYDRIGEHDVDLYAVSVDSPEASEALRRRLECDFTFLSDRDAKVLDRLNIRHRKGRVQDGGDIAFPAQILVDKDGIVRWTFTTDNYRVRAAPEDIFAAIAALG